MAKTPSKDLKLLVGLLAQPNTQALRQIDLQNMGLGEFVKAYASSPPVADLASRSSIREDAIIAELSGLLLATGEETITIIDACCGMGTLAKQILQSMGDKIARIRYLAVDEQPSSIRTIRSQRGDFDGFGSFKPIQRHVCDLHDLPRATVDLIVLNNALHEIPPRYFPAMFSDFNDLLNPTRGLVYVIDMESLPEDQPEAIAITWDAAEVEAFLEAGGLPIAITKHPKATMVYQAQIKHQKEGVKKEKMIDALRKSLKSKLRKAVTTRQQLESDLFSNPLTLQQWVVATGTIARCAEELESLDNST